MDSDLESKESECHVMEELKEEQEEKLEDEDESKEEDPETPGAEEEEEEQVIQELKEEKQEEEEEEVNLNDEEEEKEMKEESRLSLVCCKMMREEDSAGGEDLEKLLSLLVSEDLQRIRSRKLLSLLLHEYLKSLPKAKVSEVLSVLMAVLKKSQLNLEMFEGLLSQILSLYSHFNSDHLIKHFLKELIGVVMDYSIDRKEMKALLTLIESSEEKESQELLQLMRDTIKNQSRSCFSYFVFPKTKGSAMSLPPFSPKFPPSSGWTFTCWFRLEQSAPDSQGYLFYFRTSQDNVGYSAHFAGNCLVLTSMKVKGKGYQHCVPFEFKPNQWFHLVLVYINNKWRRNSSEIRVYINGEMKVKTEMNWFVSLGSSSKSLNKCLIGGKEDFDRCNTCLFYGQLSSVYIFNESLKIQQICGLHRLGPNYSGQFLFSNETLLYSHLPLNIRKAVYETKLSSALVCLYSPKHVENERLCLQLAPFQHFFKNFGHAPLLGDVHIKLNKNLIQTLSQVGHVHQTLLPTLYLLCQKRLLAKSEEEKKEAFSTQFSLIVDLLKRCPYWFGNQFLSHQTFLLVSHLFQTSPPTFMTSTVLNTLLDLTKTLITTINTAFFLQTNGTPTPVNGVSNGNSWSSVGVSSASDDLFLLLLKQLLDTILLNPRLWIHVDPMLQIKLYSYLATDFMNLLSLSNEQQNQESETTTPMNVNMSCSQSPACLLLVFNQVRRISTIIQILHALKLFYFLEKEEQLVGLSEEAEGRPEKKQVRLIRGYLLLFVKHLIVQGKGIHADELESILNYLSVMKKEENLLDVMNLLLVLMKEHPSSLIPAFDAKNGINTIFELVKSNNENIRITALLLLHSFLSRSTNKRKVDVMQPHNLFMLIIDSFLPHTPLTPLAYHTLKNILTETQETRFKRRARRSKKEDQEEEEEEEEDQEEEEEEEEDLGVCKSEEEEEEEDQEEQEKRTKYYREDGFEEEEEEEQEEEEEEEEQRIENPLILKVIALLLIQGKAEKGGKELIKRRFLNDLISLLKGNQRENRRLVLQMSVWQNWLINLIPPPERKIKKSVRNIIKRKVLHIFKLLLYHAIKYEFGGWRVWIDSLAIIHSKDSYDMFNQQFRAKDLSETDLAPTRRYRRGEQEEQQEEEDEEEGKKAMPAFRIPDFRWSNLHLKLLNQLLTLIEADFNQFKMQLFSNGKEEEMRKEEASNDKTQQQLAEMISSEENQIYVINSIHLVSQLADNIILAVGGLLPLLAYATGGQQQQQAAKEEKKSEGLSEKEGVALLYRLGNLVDILCFGCCSISFIELEQEKSMSPGGILRQILRLVSTIAVKNCLRNQRKEEESGLPPVKEKRKLLQELDMNRLRACIYRDSDSDPKLCQFLALATLYFISVLMVSKYRDIIEPHKKEEEEAEQELSAKLEESLSSVSPLLKEIILDFHSFLSKTLIGSHGQELLTRECLKTFKSSTSSSIELVMLLCSQEWQNSLQKNAGLAFIELINEGRLLSHSMKDHIVRVALEADFILNRLRADDINKHAAFQQQINELNAQRMTEHVLINQLIEGAKKRDANTFLKFKQLLKRRREAHHIRLDFWEDDSRRRRRFVQDYNLNNANIAQVMQMIKNRGKEEEADEEELQLKAMMKAMENTSLKPGKPEEYYLWDLDDDLDASNGNSGGQVATGGASILNPEISGNIVLSTECCLIWSIYEIPGVLQITSSELIFERKEGKPFGDLDSKILAYCNFLSSPKILLSDIRAIFSRKYLLQPNSVEIFLSQRTSVFFALKDLKEVKKVVNVLPPVGIGIKYGIEQSRAASLMSPKQLFKASNMTLKWIKREISNFEYLMFLNTISGRCYQDLNQYPVFPWILTNYESAELDLNEPRNYRDLSKPVGALNKTKAQFFKTRFEQMESEPAFHYGTHYSSALSTVHWLIRLEPFSMIYLQLQDGFIENKNRLFHSIKASWVSSLSSHQNVKELIPEFFYLPEMLTGITESGARDTSLLQLPKVKLPPWAKSYQHFVRLHRLALESDLVSCSLHSWIDLIFGFKQRGPESVRNLNVFYHLTYEGSLDLAQVKDETQREALKQQIIHFGQTPSQLTLEPHPPRNSTLHVTPLIFNPIQDEVNQVVKFPFNAGITFISSLNLLHLNASCNIVTINSSQQFHVHKWNPKESQQPLSLDPYLLHVDGLDSSLQQQIPDLIRGRQQYLLSIDCKHIILAPFYDNSFRVFSTESSKFVQIIFGHNDLVTCLARSEYNVNGDFFIVSASKDSTILLWVWNQGKQRVEGNFLNSYVLPKLIISGHESNMNAILISSELGLLVSASQNQILIHTTNDGQLITSIDIRGKRRSLGKKKESQVEDEEEEQPEDCLKASLEASMSSPQTEDSDFFKRDSPTDERKEKEEEEEDDLLNENESYLITNIVLSRELGYIVGIAKLCSSLDFHSSHSLCSKSLLFTYNLRGELIKRVLLKENQVKAEDQLLTITRDGEYLIMNETNNLIKIMKCFDLSPLYVLNTKDSIKSFSLIDYKYLLVGTENGKLIVYNIDFNRWQYLSNR